MGKNNIITSKNIRITIDEEYYDQLISFTWHINSDGYAVTQRQKQKIKMHRLIMDVNDPSIQIDHINGNKLDNRKANLRLCTNQQNCRNVTKRTNNKSGYKGVVWHKASNKWLAKITVNKIVKYLGIFENKDMAAKAYNNAAIKYFGEFALLNEIKDEINT